MAFATGLEGFVMLLRWCRHDVKRYEASVGKPRWFEWGYITHAGNYPDPSAPDKWYILIRLPSYLMAPDVNTDGPPMWHQRVLLFLEKLPAGKGGWEMREWPLY